MVRIEKACDFAAKRNPALDTLARCMVQDRVGDPR